MATLLAMGLEQLASFVTDDLGIPLLGAVTRTQILNRVLVSSKEYREGTL